MSLQTPRQRTGLQRPSYGSAAASPTNVSNFSASTAVNRKASLQALTGGPSPDNMRTPLGSSRMGTAESPLEVGEIVNVPGDMSGTVKFVGSVRGKNGVFVGVELDERYAARGKNSGDVDGFNYFNTSIPGAGIFLPIQRASRKYPSADSMRGSPNTPTYSTVNGTRTTATPPTPSMPPHKFSQTVGPGVRPSSPNFKPKRPSLPRPESPFRKNPPNLAPTPSRALSSSTRGARPGMPQNSSLKSSTTSRAPSTATSTPRPYSRTGSRLGSRSESILESEDRTPVGSAFTSNSRTTSTSSGVPSFSQPLRSPSRLGSAGGQDHEIQRLKAALAERDRRLEDQAASLSEMEQSVKELSSLLPPDADPDDAGPPQSTAQLRQLLREKNDKISLLTAEFDAHRADFRSTLDSLEMASTETERVYEEQKADLLGQLASMQDQLSSLQEVSRHKEDFEGVAMQLKQLEDLVAELEEGLEESRRGEAEARGEVEFLRGEVERGRSELRRERERGERSAEGEAGDTGKDDEIRGLKAIIHSLSDGQGAGAAAAATSGVDAEEMEALRAELDASRKEKESLEQELESLRRDTANGSSTHIDGTNGVPSLTNGHARHESDRTASPTKPSASSSFAAARDRSNTVKASAPRAIANGHDDADGLFCELCNSSAHDTLDCSSLSRKAKGPAREADAMEPAVEKKVAAGGAGEEEKWCALCEKDGHLAFDCPEEQY